MRHPLPILLPGRRADVVAVAAAYWCLSQVNAETDRLYELEVEDDEKHNALALNIPRAEARSMHEILQADPTALSLVEKYVVERRRLFKIVQEVRPSSFSSASRRLLS